jgi:hypothetical protein
MRHIIIHVLLFCVQVFGPIISIMKFQTDQEAVDLANDCNFGLGCAVFSKDKRRANAIASKIYCGMATINDFATTYMSQVRKGPGLCGSLALLLCSLMPKRYVIVSQQMTVYRSCYLFPVLDKLFSRFLQL